MKDKVWNNINRLTHSPDSFILDSFCTVLKKNGHLFDTELALHFMSKEQEIVPLYSNTPLQDSAPRLHS